MNAPATAADTILSRLIAAPRDKAGPLDGQEPPAAVLWPDPDGEWRCLERPALHPRREGGRSFSESGKGAIMARPRSTGCRRLGRFGVQRASGLIEGVG